MRLFLCEKPSQGRDIAKVLGASRRGDGCLIGTDSTVTWCIGHLLETAPPEAYDDQYKSWSLDHLPIIPVQWRVEVKRKTAAQFKIIKHLLSEASTQAQRRRHLRCYRRADALGRGGRDNHRLHRPPICRGECPGAGLDCQVEHAQSVTDHSALTDASARLYPFGRGIQPAGNLLIVNYLRRKAASQATQDHSHDQLP